MTIVCPKNFSGFTASKAFLSPSSISVFEMFTCKKNKKKTKNKKQPVFSVFFQTEKKAFVLCRWMSSKFCLFKLKFFRVFFFFGVRDEKHESQQLKKEENCLFLKQKRLVRSAIECENKKLEKITDFSSREKFYYFAYRHSPSPRRAPSNHAAKAQHPEEHRARTGASWKSPKGANKPNRP